MPKYLIQAAYTTDGVKGLLKAGDVSASGSEEEAEAACFHLTGIRMPFLQKPPASRRHVSG